MSKKKWGRDPITGLPKARFNRLCSETDAIGYDYRPKPIAGVNSPLWVPRSMAHAVTGMVEGVVGDSFNVSPIMKELYSDPNSPLIPISGDYGEVVAEVANKGKLTEFGKRRKKPTDPSSGSAI